MGFYSARRRQLLPMPCGSWGCRVCGPAKAYKLGVKACLAQPQRFVMLSNAGPDPGSCYEGLKRLSRALRRRSYTWEYLAVPEPHQNGSWHLHLLQKGSFIPQGELSYLAERSGMGSYVWIEAIKGDPQRVGRYLVKYMTKAEGFRPPGSRRYKSSSKFWGPDGYKGFEERYRQVFGPEWSPRYIPSGQFITEDGEVFSLGGA